MSDYPEIILKNNDEFVNLLEEIWISPDSDAQLDFFSVLKYRYPQNIHACRIVEIQGIRYYPDIAYIDLRNKILLDIEVDEPYSESGVPCHYLDKPKDKRRNELFASAGWHVLRFSEKQVMKYPEICTKLIDDFILCCKGIIHRIELDKSKSKIIDPKWSLNDSLRYMNEEKRQYYDYNEVNINESDMKILKLFEYPDDLIDNLINKKFSEFDRENKFVALIIKISNIKLHEKNNEEMIVAEFYASTKNEGSVLWFVNIPKYEVHKNKDYELFQFLITIKEENRRHGFSSHIYEKYKVYSDLILYGNYESYKNCTLEWMKI